MLSVLLRPILFATGLAVSFLPRRVELCLGPVLGSIVLRFGLFKRKIAFDNIRNCFPDLGPQSLQRLLEQNFAHYGLLFIEYLHFFSPLRGHHRRYMARHSVLEGRDNWQRAHDKGKGVLFVACHLGYWEMLAAAGGISGMPLTVVTKKLKPSWLHNQITVARLSTGVRAVYHPGAVPAILKALRKGRSVAFMYDQYTRPSMGLPVRFFDVKVYTLASVGLLAKKTGAAVVPVHTYRDKDGTSHIVIEPEVPLGQALKSVEMIAQVLASKVEQWVRQHPDQWLWIHSRFKNVTWEPYQPDRHSYS